MTGAVAAPVFLPDMHFSPPPYRKHPAEGGFTLLEILAVAIVLTILASVAIPKLRDAGGLTLHPQAQALADIVRRAQSTALARGRYMQVAIPITGSDGRIAITCFNFGTLPACDTSTNATLDFSQNVAVGGATMYFNSRGVPVDNAGVALITDRIYTASLTTGAGLSASTKTFTITVAALTGRVSINP